MYLNTTTNIITGKIIIIIDSTVIGIIIKRVPDDPSSYLNAPQHTQF